jgi:hypothetical protein
MIDAMCHRHATDMLQNVPVALHGCYRGLIRYRFVDFGHDYARIRVAGRASLRIRSVEPTGRDAIHSSCSEGRFTKVVYSLIRVKQVSWTLLGLQ